MGSWETDPHRSVLVATLRVDTTTVAWALGLRKLQIPGHMIALSGMPYAMSRNEACKACLQQGFRSLFFLDSDVICPPDTIHRLMSHRLPIVGGVYFRRSPPAGVPVAMRAVTDPQGNKGFQWITNLPPRGLIPVDVMGAGCMLISRQTLETMATKPQRPGEIWFDWRVNLAGLPGHPRESSLSEDYCFNLHAKEQFGITTMLDTSIRCHHAGYGVAGYGSFQPLDANIAA